MGRKKKPEPAPQGWAFAGQRKAHYFPAGESIALCRRVGFYFSPDRDDSNHDSADNCAECKRRRAELFPPPAPSF